MKKYVLGFIGGIVLSACTAAYASDAVQTYLFPSRLNVNGEVERLSDEYNVLNYGGHLYLPARFVVERMGGHIYYEEEKQSLTIVDERLANRQDMLAMSKVLMEYAKEGDLQQAASVIDAYAGKDRDRLFLAVDTYLHMYANEPHMDELLSLFIARKVNLEVRDEQSSATPLLVLARQTPRYITLLLDAGADVNARDYLGSTALIAVAGRGMPELVHSLLDHGADPNARAKNGYTPLEAAVFPMFTNYRQETVDTTRLLLQAKADVNAVDDEGRTPLLVAAEYAAISKPVMLLLCASGADVKVKDSMQRTALHYSAMVGEAEISAKLIALGALADEPDQDGNTPLAFAVEGIGNAANESVDTFIELIRLLVAAGANPSKANLQNVSPLSRAGAIDDAVRRGQVLSLLRN